MLASISEGLPRNKVVIAMKLAMDMRYLCVFMMLVCGIEFN